MKLENCFIKAMPKNPDEINYVYYLAIFQNLGSMAIWTKSQNSFPSVATSFSFKNDIEFSKVWKTNKNKWLSNFPEEEDMNDFIFCYEILTSETNLFV